MDGKVILEIKTPREGEETPEAMVQFLATLISLRKPGHILQKRSIGISLEIACFDQTIHFYVVTPVEFQPFLESQLISQYPKIQISQVEPSIIANYFPKNQKLTAGFLKLEHGFLYPLKTFGEFKNVDTLSSLLGVLGKLQTGESALIQYMLIPINSKWQRKGQHLYESIKQRTKDPSPTDMYIKYVTEKISYPGFRVAIRILTYSESRKLLPMVAACFNSFNNINGNNLKLRVPLFWQKQNFKEAILNRSMSYVPKKQILNLLEMATLFHMPGKLLSDMSNIYWAKTILSMAPENLPVSINTPEDQKPHTNFFARTGYKNTEAIFGIRRNDRRRHMYLIGKTGSGKSTLIANMVINDMRNREGVCVIDPHGDLCNTILDYVPSYRINDVVYLNPSDVEFPFHLNPLEIDNPAQKELIASGIVAIFYKLYADSWGPRLEYILRNTILTLLEVPNSTLVMVPEILTNDRFRAKVVDTIEDPVLKSFWVNEFNMMPDKLKAESISPILNKVGQFVASPLIRNIIGSPKSTIKLDEIMNSGKIVLMNLSQGKIGEDNSALLGAMIITKMQLAAMSRVHIDEKDRRDFYLYVDEFQNFATNSFIKILSEARKYRLNLIMANQYIAQLTPEIRSAIFGNAGTIMSFLIGAEDAPYLATEFVERFTTTDLLSLGNYRMILKLHIDGLTSSPFLAQSLPLPRSINQNRSKVLSVSRERYTKAAILPVKKDKPKEDDRPSKKQPETPKKTAEHSHEPKHEAKKTDHKPEKKELNPSPLNSREMFKRIVK